jgi:hypothetical protein
MRDPPKFCLSPMRHSRSRLKPHGCGAKRPKEGGLLWAPDGSAAFSVFGRSGFTGRCVRLVKLRGTRTTVFSRHAVLFLYNASTLIFGLVPSPLSPPPDQKFKSLGRVFFWKTWVLGCVQICRDNVYKALGISFIKYITKSKNAKCQIPSPHLELNGWSKNWYTNDPKTTWFKCSHKRWMFGTLIVAVLSFQTSHLFYTLGTRNWAAAFHTEI